MRISDWSSDVCSSDLHASGPQLHDLSPGFRGRPIRSRTPRSTFELGSRKQTGCRLRRLLRGPAGPSRHSGQWGDGSRSEEHTSELQSLMRISYAVFCLKKTKKTHTLSVTYYDTYN